MGRVGVGPVCEGAHHHSDSGPPAQAVLLCPGHTSVAAAAGGAPGGSPPFLTTKVAALAASPCLELAGTGESQAFSGGVLAVGVLGGPGLSCAPWEKSEALGAAGCCGLGPRCPVLAGARPEGRAAEKGQKREAE